MNQDFRKDTAMHFIVFFVIFNSSSSFAIEEKDCPKHDNSANFAPVRDQGNRGFCHAFAASRLFEEALCIDKKSYCGQQVSPLSIARWTTNIMAPRSSEDGWFTSEDVVAGLRQGVCLENFFPYNLYQDATQGKLKDCPVDPELSVIDQVRQMKTTFVQVFNNKCNANIIKFPKLFYQSDRFNVTESCANNHALVIKGMIWRNGRCELDLLNSWGERADFQGFFDAETFIQAVNELTSLRPKESGETVDGMFISQPKNHSFKSKAEQSSLILEKIKTALKNKRSVAASVCLNNLSYMSSNNSFRKSSPKPAPTNRNEIPSNEMVRMIKESIVHYDKHGLNVDSANNKQNYEHYIAMKYALPCLESLQKNNQVISSISIRTFIKSDESCKNPIENLRFVYQKYHYVGIPNEFARIMQQVGGK